MIYKSYKFRLFPDKSQEILLAKHFGACRFVFNHYLELRRGKKELPTLSLLKKVDGYKWLKEINSQSLQSSVSNLETAYIKFFKKESEAPAFKKKNGKQSFSIPQNIKVIGNKLIIPKFKEGINIVVHNSLEGRILYSNISKTKVGRYFVSITCEVEHEPFPKTGLSTGVDTGIKNLAILSGGKIYKNIKPLKTSLKKVKFESRQLSKKKFGSTSRVKQRRRIALLYDKVSNIRKDYLHKVSTEIIKNHDVICIEDLAIKNMMKNHNIAQSFADVSLREFYNMLDYKANWNGRLVIKVDRFYPSSKTCSVCGHIKKDLVLSDRKWVCENCNAIHDRDLNASINILNEGLKILSGCGGQSDTKQKQVEALPVGEPMKLETYLI